MEFKFLPNLVLNDYSSNQVISMKEHDLKAVDNCLNTNIYSYLETSGGKNYNLYLNVVHFFNSSLNCSIGAPL